MASNAPYPALGTDDQSLSVLQFPDNRLLIDLCGELDRHLALIEARLGLSINRRGNQLTLHGDEASRIDASSGPPPASRYARAAMSIPGVQMPHCAAP